MTPNMRSHDYHMTHLIVVVPLLIPSKGMTVEDLDVSPESGRGHIETEILLKLHLAQVCEAKLLRQEMSTLYHSLQNTVHYNVKVLGKLFLHIPSLCRQQN